MELFSVTCTTCKSRLKVRDASAIGNILACPKCGGMVMIKAPANWSEGSAVRSEQPTVSDVISASPAQDRKVASSAFEDVEDLLSDAPPKLPSAASQSAAPPSASPPHASPSPARATPSIPLPKQRFSGAPRPTPPPTGRCRRFPEHHQKRKRKHRPRRNRRHRPVVIHRHKLLPPRRKSPRSLSPRKLRIPAGATGWLREAPQRSALS
jgi:hypothetical protein